MDVWVAGAIFSITYALIATDRVHKTVAALMGGVLMIALGVVPQEDALAAIDLNVILLLLGMMVIANVVSQTGVFQWIAFSAIRMARGRPWRILVALCLITAIASAFLDNVTTVLLIAPVTLFAASALRVSPLPYLIAEILASNIGGAATLIGDPPNILIASAAGIDFVTFAANMAPIAVAVFVAFLLLCRLLFRRELRRQEDALRSIVLEESGSITDVRLMAISVGVLLLTVVGFFLAAPLGLESATIALLGASILFVITGKDPAEVFAEVEWSTLIFFVGLFMVVEGVVHAGIIDAVARAFFTATGGDVTAASIGLLWFSGVASAIVDNIPWTATMIPVISDLAGRGVEVGPLWWSLALGADLGGNATIIGASANVIIAILAARAGHEISFRRFLRYGVPVVVVSLLMSTGYLWLRYLI